MDITSRAAGILAKTEAALRTLVSEAATAGDYSAVVQITAWARAVGEIVKPAVRHSVVMSFANHGDSNRAAQPRRVPPEKTRDAYPYFFRQGDRLIRVAWSRREKKEYEHRAPYAALRGLCGAMATAGDDGRIFTTDQILPIHEDDDSEVPSYQAYVAIAFLKQAGLIDQHGRQGYSIPKLPDFMNQVESLWKNLPEK
jgi:hypothetical protein